jgi:hypothetical protein
MLGFHFSGGNRALTHGDATIYDALVHLAKRDVQPFIAASRKISEGLSFDNSIQIVHMGAGTWLDRFLKILSEGVAKTDLETLFKRVSVINFNYDRCLEQYLVHAIEKLYAITFDRAGEIVNTLKVLRPYGFIGPLPWQATEATMPYGSLDIGLDRFVALAQQIRTYSERIREEKTLMEIHDAVARADTVIYLGCAYHPQNMQILTPSEKLTNGSGAVATYGTARGISDPGISVVRNRTASIISACGRGQGDQRIQNLTCADLFQEYGMVFSK